MRVNVWLLLLFACLAKTLADELAGDRIAEPALNEGLNVYVTHPGEKGYYLAEREIWFGFFTRTNRQSPTLRAGEGLADGGRVRHSLLRSSAATSDGGRRLSCCRAPSAQTLPRTPARGNRADPLRPCTGRRRTPLLAQRAGLLRMLSSSRACRSLIAACPSADP